MNDLGDRIKSGFEDIVLRPEAAADEIFLFEVYAGTRQEELDLTDWDAPTRAAFLDMQFKAMRQGYRTMFPTADFSIILRGPERIGRMIILRLDREIRVVDLALRPGFRNQKIGTFLMQRVCAEAARAGKTVTLSVLKNTRPVGWYRRLGFATAGEAGFYEEMEWRPTGFTPAGSGG
ncbi:MAG TPA: GNAT family N-acetyltransferase [Verrucomicrobiae bacterium]|nr:GNAT family N-acetyltransferase [Verrucomicrobiae bacterium]